jgi:hypothetical protein
VNKHIAKVNDPSRAMDATGEFRCDSMQFSQGFTGDFELAFDG